MELSIIIVNYRTPSLVIDCLHSIKKWQATAAIEMIVVDNCPEDSGRKTILAAFPEVVWIQMEYNAGFARANNEGIRQSKGHTVLLLNSDTIVLEDAIQKSFALFSDSSNVACGVQLLYEDMTPQISGNYFMKGSLNNLLPLPYVGPLLKGLGSLVGVAKPHIPEAKDVAEVDWINGAFLMVKKEAISKVGLMDEDFFLYAEEAEWCSRLSRFGKLCIYGQFHVVHLQGKTANDTFSSTGTGYKSLIDKKGLQIMLSNLVRIRKQYGIPWLLFHMAVYLVTVPINFIFLFFENLFSLRNPLQGFSTGRAFAKNVVRLLDYMPKLLAGKPYFYKVL